MNVDDASAREIGGCDIETVTRIFVYKTNDKVQVLTRFEKMFEDRVIFCRPVCDRCHKVLKHISG